MKLLTQLFVVIFILYQSNMSSGKQTKLIYEKDVSEHCRRRVVPSVFLGRQVVEANARILQFSRLELPYSCFITVRTESGSNMVMMIQTTTSELQDACKLNDQLLVYEMGETFGGYWGALPESVLQHDPPPVKVYTLETTHSTSLSTESPTEETEYTTITSVGPTSPPKEHPTEEYVEIEVPLLNVSLHYVPSNENQTLPDSDMQDNFDMQYDVTPIPGVEYDRSLLPLVQFRIVEEEGGRRNYHADGEGDVEPPKYELDIIQDFTPDLRLTLPPLNPTSKQRNNKHTRRYQATRRLNFKKHRTLFHSQKQHNRRVISETITRKINDVTKYSFPTTTKLIPVQEKSTHTQDSWKVIEDLLRKLNKTKEHTILKTTMTLKEATLIQRIANMNYNKSVYLSPNISVYNINDNEEANKLFSTKSTVLSTQTSVSMMLPTTTERAELKSSSKIVEEKTTKQIGYETDKTPSIASMTESLHSEETGRIEEQVSSDLVSTVDLSRTSENPFEGRTLNNDKTPSIATMTESLHSEETGRIEEQVSSDLVFTVQFSRISENPFEGRTPHNGVGKPSQTQSSIKMNNEIIISQKTSIKNLTESDKNLSKIATGSMVGHESWENVVQAAPEMAVLLNRSVADVIIRGNASDDKGKEVSEAPLQNVLLKRKKRDIHSIAIENAQPRYLTTRKASATTTKLSFNIADMQEFAQLVEMQDDELHGRVALRYLRQYVSPPLFKLCDLKEPMKPHVHLFNSSRIVISLTNFTLERMVIILTAARALRSGEMRCPTARLECQVSGARVCMDDTVACDGVPNCGSYDIYDEDRLLCGHAASLQHNVYLAAFTFLAVLLTITYAVHYWLKRCVPKVADAFFVYSDGVENILYLNSVMRSPHEIDVDPKLAYQSHLYGDDIYDEEVVEPHRTPCQRFLRKICCCCFRNSRRRVYEKETSSMHLNLQHPMSKRMYSFTELEIRKMLTSSKDTAVQTGDSLEINPIQYSKEKKPLSLAYAPELRPATTSYDFSVMLTDSLLTLEEPLPEEHKDELSLLKFFKEARADSIAAASKNLTVEKKSHKPSESKVDTPSEQEIEIHTYDRYGGLSEPGPSKRRKIDKEKAPSVGSVSKHLRFNDVTTTISPRIYMQDNDEGLITTADGRRAVTLSEKRRRSSRLDPIEEGDEHGGGAREHRYFWGSSKGKKSKKKTHVSLK